MKEKAFEDTALGKATTVVVGGAAVALVWGLRLILIGGIGVMLYAWANIWLVPLGIMK